MNSRTIKFVGLSNRRTIELSDYRTVGPSNRRTIELGLSDYRTVGLSNRRTIDRSPHKTDLILFRIFSFVVAVGVSVGLPVELLMPFFIIQWVGPVLLIVLVFCIVFLCLFLLVMCLVYQCPLCLWIVHSWLPIRFSLEFPLLHSKTSLLFVYRDKDK